MYGTAYVFKHPDICQHLPCNVMAKCYGSNAVQTTFDPQINKTLIEYHHPVLTPSILDKLITQHTQKYRKL